MRIFRKLAQMLDVNVSGVADGDALVYDQATGKWIPGAGGGGGAPTDVDYLVGTASGDLSAEIVVGTSPGGELGGTWASPTVDATHSGSSHASVQAAAEATAAAALSAHASDTTGIHGIADTSALETSAGAQAKVDAHVNDTSAAHAASAIANTPAGNIAATDVQAALNELDSEKAAASAAVLDGDAAGGVLSGTYPNPGFASDMATQAELDAHINDTSAAHAASAISADSTTLVGTGTDVQAVLEELDNGIADHLADTSAAHAASAISIADAGGYFTATDVEGALQVLGADVGPVPLDDLVAQEQGIFSQPFDRASTSNSSIMIDGSVYLVMVGLRRGDVVNGAALVVQTAGSGVTLSKVGLYDSAGNRLAISADQGTAWQSQGTKQIAFTSAYTVTDSGGYYLAVVSKASTTLPTLRGASTSGQASTQVGSSPRAYAVMTGQTDLPTTVSPAATNAIAYWLAAYGTPAVDAQNAWTVGPAGADGAAGAGVPTGGATGEVLAKASATDYDTEWIAQSGSFTTGHSPDVPPSSPNALDDEFTDSSLDGKWSWRNQGSATWTEDAGWGDLAVPQASGQSLHGLEQSISGTFDVRCKMQFLLPGFVDYRIAGLYAANNSSGKIISIGWFTYGSGSQRSLQMYRWASSTSINAGISEIALSGGNLQYVAAQYFRLVNDGTNLKGYVSVNGRTWVLLWTEALATYVSSVDRVGIFVDNENSGSGTVVASFEWFRRIS